MSKAKKKDLYQEITDKIIAQLEQGTAPWRKTWRGGNSMPRNLRTGREYRGINVFLLAFQPYAQQCWLTFKQAQELGGNVRRGEKGTRIYFFKFLERENKQGKKERFPLLRAYTVFNVAQCDNVRIPSREEQREAAQVDPIEAAEEIVKAWRAKPEIKLGGGKCFYAPELDYVQLPPINQFETAEEYYCALFHELGHSTGHKTRLNREGIAQFNYFGSHSYSKEELIAEMTAAFLCGESGIEQATIENSAAYLQAWIKRLKAEPRIVMSAASAAQKAADLILGRNTERAKLKREVAAAKAEQAALIANS